MVTGRLGGKKKIRLPNASLTVQSCRRTSGEKRTERGRTRPAWGAEAGRGETVLSYPQVKGLACAAETTASPILCVHGRNRKKKKGEEGRERRTRKEADARVNL